MVKRDPAIIKTYPTGSMPMAELPVRLEEIRVAHPGMEVFYDGDRNRIVVTEPPQQAYEERVRGNLERAGITFVR